MGTEPTTGLTPGEPPRFSIRLRRSVWFYLTAVCVFVLMAGYAGISIYQRQAAICEIERLGGEVYARLDRPEWLRQGIGDKWMTVLDEGVSVDLSRTPTNDASLGHLKWLTSLKSLELDNTQVTDAGLVHLKGLTSLKAFDLNDTQVSDAGLVHLKGLKSLRWLAVSWTRVTDAGIADLKQALPTVDVVK